MKKSISIIINVILVFLLLEAIFMTTCSLLRNEQDIVQIKDQLLVPVTEKTMQPSILKNDLIFVEALSNKMLMENAVIAYLDSQKELHTGRISSIERIDEEHSNYHLSFDHGEDSITIGYDNIVGVWTSSKIPFLGGVFQFLLSQRGFLLGVILPLALIFFYQIVQFFISMKKDKKVESI